MKAFVTGASGFIGGRLVRKLVERGDEVRALVRSDADVTEMKMIGATPVRGDITDAESLREAMQGCDVVFHVAAWYKIGAPDWQMAEKINVEGSRIVLGLAYQLGIPKIVYTSTVAVFGDTRGRLVDESYRMPENQPFLSEYDRTKWEAHYRVAKPLIEKGAPIVIVIPGAVYGPGDHSLVGEMMERFHRAQLPVNPAPEMALTFAHVDDIAEAHILAAEKGKPGEEYIITGPAMTMSEMVRLWADITGRPKPLAEIPARFLKPFAPLLGAVSQIIPLPPMFSQDATVVLDATYTARADKARETLGWRPRPLREGLQETFDWIAHTSPPLAPVPIQRRRLAGLALGAALGMLAVWLLARDRD